ncbi:hypothetical protein D3C76_1657920 [compost metagenome]
MQQGNGQPRQQQSGDASDSKQSPLFAVQACPGAIEKDHCFTAFTADRQHRQQQQTDTALTGQLLVGVTPQVVFERVRMAVHPADHLHHQQAGQ